MEITNNRITVAIEEEVEQTQVKRTCRVLLFFKTEWWETVSTKHIGNDIHILTDRPIRDVYLNREKIADIS